jgi:hypothetical protein
MKTTMVGQEKGGVGKTTGVRALADAVPDAGIVELETSHRLLEWDDRVNYLAARVDAQEVERTGGLAQREAFDPLINAIATASSAMIVDIGANTSTAAFLAITEVAPSLAALGLQIGVVIVATADPAAIAAAGQLMEIVRPWAAQRFLLENQLHGPIPHRQLLEIGEGTTITTLAHHAMDPKAISIVNAGGFSSLPRLDPAALNQKFGLMRGLRIMRDLHKFRLAAMRAVEPAAVWLVS